MVALHAEALQPHAWPDEDLEPAPQVVRLVVVERRRRLPDRATRIRRRRLAVLLAFVLLLSGIGALAKVAFGGSGAGNIVPEGVTGTVRGPITEDVYVVQPGDTLWSIAERLAPDEDPRPIVAALRELNGGVELDVGDRVPVGEI